MAFCPKCGTEYTEGTRFCGVCGANLEPAAQETPAPTYTPIVNRSFFDKLLDTKDVTAECDPADIQNNKVVAILGYCASFAYLLLAWFTVSMFGVILAAGFLIAPILMAKNSKFLHFHATQAITLLLTTIIVQIFDGTLSSWCFLLLFNPWAAGPQVAGTIISWLIHVVFMAIPVIIGIFGIINAAQGKAKALPLIGRIQVIIDSKK